MPHFLVAQIQINDREEYRQYEAGFMDIFKRFKGRMLAVDEAPQLLEGQWPYTRTVLIEFPDEASARAWYESPEYQALATHRYKASEGNLVMLKGLG